MAIPSYFKRVIREYVTGEGSSEVSDQAPVQSVNSQAGDVSISTGGGFIPSDQIVASYDDLPLTDRSQPEMWFVSGEADIVASTQLSPVEWRSMSDYTLVASAVFDRVVEDFERTDPLTDYLGSTSGWSVTTTDVIEGDRALAQDGASGGNIIHTNNSVEGDAPQRGEVVACLRRSDSNDDDNATGFLLLDDAEWTNNSELSGYYIRHFDGNFQLFRVDNESLTELDSTAIDGGDPNGWADIEVISDGDDLTGEFYNVDSSVEFEQEESRESSPSATLTVTDGTYNWGRYGFRAPLTGSIIPTNDYLRVV